ncbi:MAG: hypothetical protein NZ518_05160 [Dehalococcoidia bacterium]|nr:hypothetical protein [Dehalococcoidia bacterium]
MTPERDADAIERALDEAARWMLTTYGTPLKPSQRAVARRALTLGYLFGDHDDYDPDRLPTGAAYAYAADALGMVSVIIRALDDGQFVAFVGLDPQANPSLATLIEQLGGVPSDNGVIFLLRAIEDAPALVETAQTLYQAHRPTPPDPP